VREGNGQIGDDGIETVDVDADISYGLFENQTFKLYSLVDPKP
jgi:hypothetical protein